MSLQLKLFGGLSLSDSESKAVRVTRRHRLAVLAVLASADRPVPRERLLALLWPDSSDESARHALGQLLYGLRQDVALAELVTGATDLSLNRTIISCDLWRFREALVAGNRRAAIEAYDGPFLDGVVLPNADEFERWCATERATLANTAATAMEALAQEATARSDQVDALHWWRRLVNADPLSSRFALGFMRALVVSGDRAAAIQHERVHSTLVRTELDSAADPTVLAYAQELRASELTPAVALSPAPASPTPTIVTPSSATPPIFTPASATTTIVPTTNGDPRVIVDPYQPAVAASPEHSANGTHARTTLSEPLHAVTDAPRRGATAWLRVAAVVFVLGAVATIGRTVITRRDSVPTNRALESTGIPVLAVLPFDVRGDTTRAFLGEALSALLSARLDAPGVLRTLESNSVLSALAGPRTSERKTNNKLTALGATVLVHGTVVVLGDQLELDAELTNTGDASAAPIRSHVAGAADSLFALADKLGAALLIAREGRTLGNPALGGTHSVPALKALLVGERALRALQFTEAIAAYKTSLAIDSTYAFAWYRLAFAEDWDGVGAGRQSRAQATRFAAQLPDRYALLLAAQFEQEHGNIEQAERDLLTLVQRYPTDAEPWAALGEFRMHIGPTLGQPTSNAEAPLARTFALDSAGHPEVRYHLSQLALERGDIARVQRLLRPMNRSGGATMRSMNTIGMSLAFTQQGLDSTLAVVQSLRDAPVPAVARGLRIALSSIGAQPRTIAVAESLSASGSGMGHRLLGLAVLMELDVARNAWTALQRHAALLAVQDSLAAADEWIAVAQAPDAVVAADLWRAFGAYLERAASADSSASRPERLYGSIVMAVRANDESAYVRRLRALTALTAQHDDGRELVRVARTFHATMRGDNSAHATDADVRTSSPPIASQFGRWLRAEWYEQRGEFAEAERWYLSVPWGPLALVFTRPSFEGASRVAWKRGDRVASKEWSRRASAFSGAAAVK